MENLINPEKDDTSYQKPCQDFDQILNLIGSEGKFQNILLYAVICPMVAIGPFLGMQVVFMWDIPDHYCHVPGWNSSEVSLETWKNLTLPWELGPDGNSRHSQCKMMDQLSGNLTSCQFGWEYDKKDYDRTIPMEFNWVCDRDHYVTDCFTWGSVGAAVGTIIFGVLADKFGRKLIFFVACLITCVFTTWSLWWPGNVMVYKGFQFLTWLAASTIFTMPTLIICEVSSSSFRSWIYSVTWMTWVIGNASLPLVAWLCRDWWIFGVTCVIPGFLQLFYYPVVCESPMWLISVGGREEEAVKIILRIAKVNGRKVDEKGIERMVDELGKKFKGNGEENGGNVGIWSLFSKWRVALSTIMLLIAWSMNGILYYGLTLHTTKMAGNVFLNYFLLSIIELPGGWLAGKLVEKTGRRWTQAGFFLMCTLSCLVCAVAVMFNGMEAVVIIGALGIKFAVTVTSLVVYLQSTEIFPTMLRSSGTGFISTVSSGIGIISPYIVYSGTVHVSLPYALLCICAFLGFVSASCLPETLNQPLPETIEDANKFTKGQRFWSYLPNKVLIPSGNISLPMNKTKIDSSNL